MEKILTKPDKIRTEKRQNRIKYKFEKKKNKTQRQHQEKLEKDQKKKKYLSKFRLTNVKKGQRMQTKGKEEIIEATRN